MQMHRFGHKLDPIRHQGTLFHVCSGPFAKSFVGAKAIYSIDVGKLVDLMSTQKTDNDYAPLLDYSKRTRRANHDTPAAIARQ